LTISARLVALMGGVLGVDSTVGRGSTFHFSGLFGVADPARLPGGDRAAAAAPLSPATAADRPAWRVLLAEDNPVNQKLVVRLLEKQGHTVVVAGNGREALAVIEAEPFDVVLLDVQMPEVDGFEAAGIIRARERTTGGHLPLIALTAHAMKGDRERCLAAGMDDYLAKPIHAAELFAVIKRTLARHGPPPDPPDEAVFDEAAVRAVVGEESELLGELVATFRESCPPLLEQLREAVARRDGHGVERAAHTLKGAVAVFAAGAATDAARRLEAIGREGKLDDADAALEALEEELARLRPALDRLAASTPAPVG
jgi:CheY-like chemotaxis protein/HPt (histidine-containing phosphotransfer) domain-containing protein